MTARQIPKFLSYGDRLMLAYEHAKMVFERRGGFISDDDILDLADDWTTDRRDDTYEFITGDTDWEHLRDDLHDAVFEPRDE